MPLQAGTKGAARKITGGKYCGLNCWIDDSRRHPETQVYVCVQLISGEEKEIWTRISKKYCQAPPKAPVTFPEAVMQQHNDVEKAMNKLCLLLVKCQTCETTNRIKETNDLFKSKLEEAFHNHIAIGHKREYRVTEFDEKRK